MDEIHYRERMRANVRSCMKLYIFFVEFVHDDYIVLHTWVDTHAYNSEKQYFSARLTGLNKFVAFTCVQLL